MTRWTLQPGKIRVDRIAGEDRYQVALIRPCLRVPTKKDRRLVPLFTLPRGRTLRAFQWLDRRMGA